VLSTEKLAEIARSLGRVIRMQEQVYWVCPLVEESEDSDLAAATQRFEDLNKLYPGKVVLLHGRMKPDEKDAIMAAFKAGEFKIMVATTVIEVGVDVPQATTMVIEHAERFGLSQLHQLRGRVGRGALKSFCLLLYSGRLGQFAQERLDIMRRTEDGFLIAEKDLQLRGPGEMLGTQQAGQVEFRIADLSQHQDLLPLAREMADTLLADPNNRAGLQNLLRMFNKDEASRLLRSG
jgi:ATP-dependent DNA helicase RecG